MGWNSYNAITPISIKRECTRIIESDPDVKVLRSIVRNNVHYAAVLDLKTGEVFATVIVTDIDLTDKEENFAYRDMDETVGPQETDCPATILDMLSPTDNKYALEWRQKCREKIHKESERRRNLTILPVGTRIRTTIRGKEYILRKRAPNTQFKTVWWHCEAENTFVKQKFIESFEII